jgi:hypothetical protein
MALPTELYARFSDNKTTYIKSPWRISQQKKTIRVEIQLRYALFPTEEKTPIGGCQTGKCNYPTEVNVFYVFIFTSQG